MATEEDHEVYSGILKKLSKDGTKYVVECPAVSEWYGVDARMPEAEKPQNIGFGDTIDFTVSTFGSGAPIVTWAEKAQYQPKKAKRKVEEFAAPAEGQELYVGTIRKQSTKNASMYLIDCPVVTQWYKCDAKASADVLFLAGAGVGDEITFSLESEDVKEPLVGWAERAGSSAAKRQRTDAEPKAAKSDASAAAKPKAQDASSQPASDELMRLKEELMAERTAKLEAQLEAERTKAAAQKEELERLKSGSARSVQAAAAGGPASDSDSDEDLVPPQPNGKDAGGGGKGSTEKGKGKGKGNGEGKDKGKGKGKGSTEKGKDKGKGKGKGKTMIAEIRFGSADDALAALSLYGTELHGAEVRPEADGSTPSGRQVLVKNLPYGTTNDDLREHFGDVGKILHCAVRPESGKSAFKFVKGADTGPPKGADKGTPKGTLKGAKKGSGGKPCGGKPGGPGGKGGGPGGKSGGGGKTGSGKGAAAGGGGGGRYAAVGELRFADTDAAEAALGLYDSELAGHPEQPIRVELDERSTDGTKVRVFGLPGGLPQAALREHFGECGTILFAKVHEAKG